MTAPYLGQIFDADTVGVTIGDIQYLIVRLDPDGSRRPVDAGRVLLGPGTPTWEQARDAWLGRWDNDPIMFWGEYDARLEQEIDRGVGTQFMPYPPADGVPVPPVDDPVNQVPYLTRFQRNAAVSAHDLQVTLRYRCDAERHRRRLQHRQEHVHPPHRRSLAALCGMEQR